MNQLLFANQHANRGSFESIFLAKSILEKAEIGGGDIVGVPDKQGKDRWFCRDLGHEGRFRDLRRFAFAHREGMGGEDFLEELIQGSSRDPL